MSTLTSSSLIPASGVYTVHEIITKISGSDNGLYWELVDRVFKFPELRLDHHYNRDGFPQFDYPPIVSDQQKKALDKFINDAKSILVERKHRLVSTSLFLSILLGPRRLVTAVVQSNVLCFLTPDDVKSLNNFIFTTITSGTYIRCVDFDNPIHCTAFRRYMNDVGVNTTPQRIRFLCRTHPLYLKKLFKTRARLEEWLDIPMRAQRLVHDSKSPREFFEKYKKIYEKKQQGIHKEEKTERMNIYQKALYIMDHLPLVFGGADRERETPFHFRIRQAAEGIAKDDGDSVTCEARAVVENYSNLVKEGSPRKTEVPLNTACDLFIKNLSGKVVENASIVRMPARMSVEEARAHEKKQREEAQAKRRETEQKRVLEERQRQIDAKKAERVMTKNKGRGGKGGGH